MLGIFRSSHGMDDDHEDLVAALPRACYRGSLLLVTGFCSGVWVL